MGLFDSIISGVNKATSAVNNAQSTVNRVTNTAKSAGNAASTVASAVGKGKNKDEKFTFNALPTNVAELQADPLAAKLDSAFKTTALAIAALCNYANSPEDTFAMLDALRGPEPLSTYDKSFIRDRLAGKEYKPFSFFAGATVANGYTPTTPYVITVSENPYSFDEENYATLFVTSAGADSPRPVKLRKKPSTGEWFLTDIQCLADIRIPAEQDPWA